MKFVFELSEEQAQKVLNALVKEPYAEVAEVVEMIQRQAIEQRQANQEG